MQHLNDVFLNLEKQGKKIELCNTKKIINTPTLITARDYPFFG